MKQFFYTILTLMLFTACTLDNIGASIVQDEDEKENIVASITLDQTSINFDEHADSQTIYFTSALDWTAEFANDRADSWCSISATSGKSGNGQITVNVTDNTSPDNRTASIIIKSGPISKTVRISQKQKDALTVTASSFELESTSGKIYIEVKANIDFEYTINGPAEDWITPVNTRAMKTSKLGFNIAENNSLYSREGTITIHSGDMQEVVNLYQHGNERGIVISQKEFVISDEGDEISVEVSSNLDIEIEMPDVDWITRNTSRAVSTNTYYFTIAENTSYDQREAYISFINKEKKVSEQVKITQAQKDAIVLAANQYNINSDGEQITIEIGHNVDFDYEIVGEWITKVETRALATDYLTFNIAPNTSYDSREGSIIFTSKDGSLSQTAKIFQAQKDAVIISDDDIVINNLSQQVSFEIEANVEYSVSEPDANWVHLVSTRALTSRTLTYDIDENTTHDSREAHIVVTNKTNNSSQTITITQAQKDAIVLAASTYEIDMEGGALDFDIMTNVEVCVSISDNAKSWITHLSSRALQSKTLHFDIAEYDGDDTREGIITLSGGGVTQTVTISQSSWQNLKDNKIYYTTSNNSLIVPNDSERWNNNDTWGGAKIMSHTYENGQGVITFSRNLTKIGDDVFYGCKSLSSITIPNKVTTIGTSAFNDCTSLTTVTFSSGLEAINDLAFHMCTALTSVNIPDSTKTIGAHAFDNCYALATVTLGSNLETIGYRAFNDCAMTQITIPNSVKTIDNEAFIECPNLKEVSLGNSLEVIGDWAFAYCKALENITFNSKLESIRSFAFLSCEALKSINIPDSVTSLGQSAFQGCHALNSMTLGSGLKTIGESAFNDCRSLTNIIIPNSVKTIDSYAFFDCYNLATVTLGSGLESIGEYAFYNCNTLTSITIPNSVKTIGNNAFYTCSHLATVTLGSGLEYIGTAAFAYSALESITIPESVTEITGNPFAGCKKIKAFYGKFASEDNSTLFKDNVIIAIANYENITDYNIPNGITKIIDHLFYGWENLKSVTIPDSVTEIGESAFENCTSLTSIVIPNSVTKIANSAFQYCSNLTNVSMSENLEILGEKAFWNCTSLSSIIIPDGVKEISYDAFSECHNLSEISLGSGVEIIGSHAFNNNYTLTAINLPNTVKTINEYAFQGCSNLKSITIPDKVTSIGGWAFYNCSSLTSVTLGSNLEAINDWAFHLCTSLTSINIPDSVKTIGSNVFDDCYSLATVTLGNSLEYIGERAFNDCAMTNIIIPNSVKTIGIYAFLECPNLKEVYLGNSLEVISDRAFENCHKLTAISIPDKTKSIGSGAFAGCRNLATLDLGNGVETIYNEAFNECVSLNSITIPQSVKEITGNPFTGCSGIKAFYGKFASEDNSTLVKDNEIIAIADQENITDYTIPNGITKIGNRLFQGWRNLKSVTIPNSVTKIGESAFESCDNIQSINIPNSVTEIGSNAFCYCSNLQTINIPEGVTTIKNSCFSECRNLKQITLPNSLTKIESYAFVWSGLTNITIPNNVTEIDCGAFAGCEYLSAFNGKFASADKRSLIINNELVAFAHAGATEYNIPEGVTTLKDMSFGWVMTYLMANISLPNSLTTIESCAFYDCRTISEITIPENVRYIGGWNIETLSKIYCKAKTPPTLEGNPFNGSQASTKTIYVPTESVETYKKANVWRDFAHLIVGYDF